MSQQSVHLVGMVVWAGTRMVYTTVQCIHTQCSIGWQEISAVELWNWCKGIKVCG